ncbi:cytochrome c biogenesis protein CcsA [Helicobacter winghamensis]|uniref:Cytochrome C biogenesis protein n=1 Tax=Helicobacter winghamensis TaxID=157268 RepID=A0A2N3PIX6_9HELI|nr:cytochrome c biogenesis protein CcsA [Helicobacter winghamensis]EEO25271.1 putative cytochrome c-type biogenesis protein CcsB [Helicobacter winghamensis ATCC BAA-430]PKT76313.1 cytochrome C biogenesis protein [Helicobacter winghamensis]PKT76444.1 cytochrome C biogenesis protein [Helicobacter winghamensis]PKT76575.1 cytochrome C biogenesis protein [Helicobacter winghamensis]PKT80824.1 cytochrome C biogenesis protein [Helicobacter winghamensis]
MDIAQKFIKSVIEGFCNFWVTIVLLIAYGSACGVATFVENDYGTPSARALIYNTQWFDLLHLLLVLNLIGVLFLSRALQRKKYASFLFHFSLVVIFIGAAITRYYGFEGTMHIREGEQSNIIESQEEFVTILVKQENKLYRAFFPTTITPLVQKPFLHIFPFENQNLEVQYVGFIPAKDKMDTDKLKVKVSFNGESKELEIAKGMDQIMPFVLGGKRFALDWGSRSVVLPFAIALKDFELERYAGSMSPSSYASEVVILDPLNGIEESHRIYMNNVLDYGGFRFFQSSYDLDEQGTILSVNKDPGKIPTYIGYTMLTLGLLWAMFARNGRFYRLGQYLKAQNLVLAFVFCFGILSAIPLHATPQMAQQAQNELEVPKNMESKNDKAHSSDLHDNEIFEELPITTESILDLIKNLKEKSGAHSEKFGRLIVQDFGGRMKPMDTLAMEYVLKMTKQNGFLGLNNMQLFLGMMVYPNEFRKVKMLAVSTPKLKEIIGVDKKTDYVAFEDLFINDTYKLINYLEEANRKKPAMRDKFDKDVMSLDERVNVAYLIYTAQSLKILPDFNKASDKWFTPSEAIASFDKENAEQLQKLFGAYFNSFHYGLVENDWENADFVVEALGGIQNKFGADLIPPKLQVDLEIFLNHYNLFDNLTPLYICFGILLFGIVLVQIFRHKSAEVLASRIVHWIIALLVLTHTIALGLRWYVGGHAPWSNAYESMIYIAWAAGISGVVFFRRSYLAQSMASFLAGISLFVAHLGFMDPQIGNLVPVLKSYWLNIHVSIITASYGFLGLCFMLGALTLALFILRKPKYLELDRTILTLHTINEMAMILGLAMLTVGNFLGGVWANESWGRYWGWDPKETWALISIVVYVIVLHARFIPKGNNPYVFAALSVVAFYSILMTYFGVNFYLSGLHSYAAGDPLPIPVFLYYFIAITILLIVLAARKADLPSPKLP